MKLLILATNQIEYDRTTKYIFFIRVYLFIRSFIGINMYDLPLWQHYKSIRI